MQLSTILTIEHPPQTLLPESVQLHRLSCTQINQFRSGVHHLLVTTSADIFVFSNQKVSEV
jgi:hypothetical protein